MNIFFLVRMIIVQLYKSHHTVVGSGKVVVYGSTVDVYCCVQTLLQTGLPGHQIVIVEPPSQVTRLLSDHYFDLPGNQILLGRSKT